MNSKSTLGLSILAGGLAFVGSANATDLLVNGSFEQPPGTGWVGSFGSYNYSAAYFSGPAIPQSEHPGDNYSWRHGRSDTDFSSPLTQTVSLSSVLTDAQIDSALGQFTFSAWMASYTDPERPYITLQFFDTSGTTQVGGTTVFDRTAGANFTTFADGVTVFDNGAHEGYWAKYVRTAAVPIGARSARVGITRSPNAGVAGRPDTYVDLVKLDVQAVAAVPPSVDSAQPTGGNVRPDVVIKILLEDGSTQVNTDSIQLKLD